MATSAFRLGYTGYVYRLIWQHGDGAILKCHSWGGGGGGGARGNLSKPAGDGQGGGYALGWTTINNGDSLILAVGGGGTGGKGTIYGYAGQAGAGDISYEAFNLKSILPSDPIYQRVTNRRYCTFLNENGVWVTPSTARFFNVKRNIIVPFTQDYTFVMSADNSAICRIDGVNTFGADTFVTTFTQTVRLTAGIHEIEVDAVNTGGPGSVALSVTPAVLNDGQETRSFSGARGGQGGPGPASGGGGGGGAATLILQGSDIICVAPGGGGGGGSGLPAPTYSNGLDAPGPNGTASPPTLNYSAGQNGQNRTTTNSGGGGGGGGGYFGGNGGTAVQPNVSSGAYGGTGGTGFYASIPPTYTGFIESTSSATPAQFTNTAYFGSIGIGGYEGRLSSGSGSDGHGGGIVIEFFTPKMLYHDEFVPFAEVWDSVTGLWIKNNTGIAGAPVWREVTKVWVRGSSGWEGPMYTQYPKPVKIIPTSADPADTISTLSRPLSDEPEQAGGGGGGCCVIATALSNNGRWSKHRLTQVVAWCERKLHGKWWGETLRRGYQVIGSRLVGLLIKPGGPRACYAEWAFRNATNMLRGKKFSLWSVPHTMFWCGLMFAVGCVVSKSYAENKWQSLYEK